MMKKRTLYGWLMLFMAGFLTGCSQETQVTEITGNADTKVQQVRFYVSSGHIEDAPLTRDVPPVSGGGTTTFPGTCQVDRIALLTFKRPMDTDNPFLFDQANSVAFDEDGKITSNNSMELECKDYPGAPAYPSETSSYQKQAIGKITKQKGYEYKVIALGYNTKREDDYPTGNNSFDERDCFQIVAGDGRGIDESTSLSEVKLKLKPLSYSDISSELAGTITDQITGAWLRTPELFFANCSIAGDEDGIIQFADTKEITGVLKRGVAQVNLNITDVHGAASSVRHVCQFSFLADVLNTEVRLENYDCFLQPSAPLGANEGYIGRFTALNGEGTCEEINPEIISFTVYVLPTVTSLRIRYKTSGMLHGLDNYFDSDIAVTSKSDGNQATGIIDPEGGGKTFYLRRNHRYTINGTGKQIAKNDQ